MSWDPKVRQPEDEARTRNSQLCISALDSEFPLSGQSSDCLRTVLDKRGERES